MVHLRKLVDPTEEEIARATQVLIDSVGSNPFCQAVCGWNQSILKDNFRARTENGIKDGWVYCTGIEEGRIDGVVFYNPPGYDFGYSKHLGGPIKNYRERVSGDIQEWLNSTFLPAYYGHIERAMGKTGIKDSLFVNLIGINPSAQGHGLGSKLMREIIALADSEGVEMMLDTQTESTVGWYQSFGFEIRDKAEIDVKGEKVVSWGMVRPARPTTKQ